MLYNCQQCERSVRASSTLIERPEKQKHSTCKTAWPEMGEGIKKHCGVMSPGRLSAQPWACRINGRLKRMLIRDSGASNARKGNGSGYMAGLIYRSV